MMVTGSSLIRWSGLAAMVAGVLFIGIQPIHPPETLASVTTNAWAIVHIMTIAMSMFGLVGIVGLYARQVKEAGWLGLAGFLLLGLWLVLITGFTFAEALILPPLAAEAPTFVAGFMGISSGLVSEVTLGLLEPLYGVTGALYLIGGLLFGIASFRARILSRWGAGILAFGAVAALATSLVPHEYARFAAVPTGLGLAWLGYSLWSKRAATSKEVQA
jgi:hypothetical protein